MLRCGSLGHPAPRFLQAHPGRARVFLARQPPPPGGFRGAPSVHEGGHRPPRTALASALSPAPRGPSRRPVRLVLGRAPGNSARRRAACGRAAAPARMAALNVPASAPCLLLIRFILLVCSGARSHLLTQDEGGRSRSGVLSQFGPEVRGRSQAPSSPIVAELDPRPQHHLAELAWPRAGLETPHQLHSEYMRAGSCIRPHRSFQQGI